jgi:hypothetical protein
LYNAEAEKNFRWDINSCHYFCPFFAFSFCSLHSIEVT